jgi:hypothetical protein
VAGNSTKQVKLGVEQKQKSKCSCKWLTIRGFRNSHKRHPKRGRIKRTVIPVGFKYN